MNPANLPLRLLKLQNRARLESVDKKILINNQKQFELLNADRVGKLVLRIDEKEIPNSVYMDNGNYSYYSPKGELVIVKHDPLEVKDQIITLPKTILSHLKSIL